MMLELEKLKTQVLKLQVEPTLFTVWLSPKERFGKPEFVGFCLAHTFAEACYRLLNGHPEFELDMCTFNERNLWPQEQQAYTYG
jgi:hypothetical protein